MSEIIGGYSLLAATVSKWCILRGGLYFEVVCKISSLHWTLGVWAGCLNLHSETSIPHRQREWLISHNKSIQFVCKGWKSKRRQGKNLSEEERKSSQKEQKSRRREQSDQPSLWHSVLLLWFRERRRLTSFWSASVDHWELASLWASTQS